MRLLRSFFLIFISLAIPASAWAAEPVVLTYEPRPDLPASEQIGRRFAEALATGLAGMVEAVAMVPARSSALLDGGAQACAVMHARSPARERGRRWVAELSRSRTYLVSRDAKMAEPAAGDYVVALAGSPYEELARGLGAQVEPIRKRSQIFQMFQARRAAYWVEDRRVLEDAVRDGMIPGFHVIRELAGQSGWLACSLAVPDPVVAALAMRLEALRADGTARTILHDAGHGDGSTDGRSSATIGAGAAGWAAS